MDDARLIATLGGMVDALDDLTVPKAASVAALRDESMMNAGAVLPHLHLMFGDKCPGGHLQYMMEDPTGRRSRHEVDCDPLHRDLILLLDRLWRDRHMSVQYVNVDAGVARMLGMTEAATVLEHMNAARDRSPTLTWLRVLMDALRTDMPDMPRATTGRAAAIWQDLDEDGLVVDVRRCDRTTEVVCRTTTGREIVHRDISDLGWLDRFRIADRIMIRWRGRTNRHPGYVDRVLDRETLGAFRRRGEIAPRRMAMVDVNHGTKVVMTGTTRDARIGEIGEITGYGDGTCRVAFDDGREIDVRPERMRRKRRGRNGNRDILMHSIL